MDMLEKIHAAANSIEQADALIVTAGAGMGVDSGLPDFRGVSGFWRAYPMYERLGLQFEEAANPQHFKRDPAFGWGFYGHRLNLYRSTQPHAGFAMLRAWVDKFQLDLFVVTSNVDGQFQLAGYPDDSIWEIHGSINHLQCVRPCNEKIWENHDSIAIDNVEMRADTYPKCPDCGSVARPNILMFGDWDWLSWRSDEQQQRFQAFVNRNRERRVVIIELGAGTALPTIRHLSERLATQLSGRCIRINPREPEISAPNISLPGGALESLHQIDALLKNS